MTNSLKNRIARYVYRKDGWVDGTEVERLALKAGYKASNASRRARELVEEGIFERKEEKTVKYRCDHLPFKMKTEDEWTNEEKIKIATGAR